MRELIREHIQYNIGDGRQMSLFYDNWLQSIPIVETIGNNVSSWGESLTVRSWWNSNGWSIPASFSRRYPEIAATIQRCSLNEMADSCTWKIEASGKYTVRSMYEASAGKKGRKVAWDNIVWSSQIPPKYSFCLWLLWKGAMKTRIMLCRRGVDVGQDCEFCHAQNEDCSHLFFDCELPKAVWKEALAATGINRNPSHWGRVQRWIQRNARGRGMQARKIKKALAITVYYRYSHCSCFTVPQILSLQLFY